MKTGLVLEGGAFRTIFSAGVLDAFLDRQLPLPDYTVGVSAGAAYGVSYLSRQSRRNLQLLCTYVNDKRYMGIRHLLDPENRSYFDLDFSYNIIPNQLLPFDYETFMAYPGEMEAVVTNLDSGNADYLTVPRHDKENEVLQATCALPYLFPIYHINGQPYLDGGCADPIPWKRAFDLGCDRVVVLLTRERDYSRTFDPRQQTVLEQTFRNYPHFLETMAQRADHYNHCREELFAQEAEGKVIVLCPSSTRGFSRTERDLSKIRSLWQDGYFTGLRAVDAVRSFWTESGSLSE